MVDVIVSFVVGAAISAFVVRKFFPRQVIEVRTVEKIVEVPVEKVVEKIVEVTAKKKTKKSE